MSVIKSIIKTIVKDNHNSLTNLLVANSILIFLGKKLNGYEFLMLFLTLNIGLYLFIDKFRNLFFESYPINKSIGEKSLVLIAPFISYVKFKSILLTFIISLIYCLGSIILDFIDDEKDRFEIKIVNFNQLNQDGLKPHNNIIKKSIESNDITINIDHKISILRRIKLFYKIYFSSFVRVPLSNIKSLDNRSFFLFLIGLLFILLFFIL